MKRLMTLALVAAACGGADAAMEEGQAPGGDAAAAAEAAVAQIGCVPSDRMPVEGRASPYDSVRFTVAGATAQICYNRPFAKGRTIFGGLIPWDQLWRTGANEPTTIHLPVAASIAGVAVEPGSYSIYTVPSQGDWTVIVNASTSQWGHENSYTPEVEALEMGRGTAPSTPLEEPVEQFTIRTEPEEGDATHLILEWERTQVRIPVSAR